MFIDSKEDKMIKIDKINFLLDLSILIRVKIFMNAIKVQNSLIPSIKASVLLKDQEIEIKEIKTNVV